MSMFAHPNRGRRWKPPAPVPEPEPEPKVIMSICMWCDFCQRPYPDSDIDSVAMTVPVPKIENGVKVGIAYTIENHKCGDCMRDERRIVEKRRAISAGEQDAEKHLQNATREAWAEQ